MPRPPFQSVEVRCEAAQDLSTGVTNCFLSVNPGVPPKAEYVLTTLRREVIELEVGAYYRVTFQKIEPKGTLAASRD